ncbi:Ribonuclease [Trichinella spiralis]|uniref:Ribonuclease n=1 Tax=Trichinella spiralis TaxID=6334 RepID=A0ABR3KG42_TRISP
MPETEQHLAEPCSSSLVPAFLLLLFFFFRSLKDDRLAVSIAAQTERRPTMFDVGVVCFQPRHYLNNDLAVSLNLLQAFRPRTD